MPPLWRTSRIFARMMCRCVSGTLIIVSNPPYVDAEINRLQREVREHVRHVALFSWKMNWRFRRLISSALNVDMAPPADAAA
jgi:methylase of polypeptide subunit release factors